MRRISETTSGEKDDLRKVFGRRDAGFSDSKPPSPARCRACQTNKVLRPTPNASRVAARPYFFQKDRILARRFASSVTIRLQRMAELWSLTKPRTPYETRCICILPRVLGSPGCV